MTPQLQLDHSPCSKPAHVTETSSAPSPAPQGWDVHVLHPHHDLSPCSGTEALCPSLHTSCPPHLPKLREKPTALKSLQNYGAFQGLEPDGLRGTHASTRVALRGPVTSPLSQSCPATAGPFFLVFLNFLPSFALIF